jgi:hypothetical protein
MSVLFCVALATFYGNGRRASEEPGVSAVIYAAIVVMWAVVLVPMWLRRHDAATESRSVDRFSTAMRTLARRTTSAPGRRYVVMPRRSAAGVSVHVSGAPTTNRAERVATAVLAGVARSKPVRRRGKASLVARRRRMLLGLLAVTTLTVLLGATGVISWPLQIVVDVILLSYCLHLRMQARRAAAVSRQRRRATVAPAAAAPTTPAAPVVAAYEPAAPVFAPPVDQPMPAAEPEPVAGVDDEDSWEPVPVPRPTYAMKPPAPAYEADPTYAPPVYRPEPDAEPIPAPVAEVDTDLEDILDRRWAVND